MHLKLSTDKKFALSDENYLFDNMGLTKTSPEELEMMFDPKITEFLKKSELVQTVQKKVENSRATPLSVDVSIAKVDEDRIKSSVCNTPVSVKQRPSQRRMTDDQKFVTPAQSTQLGDSNQRTHGDSLSVNKQGGRKSSVEPSSPF